MTGDEHSKSSSPPVEGSYIKLLLLITQDASEVLIEEAVYVLHEKPIVSFDETFKQERKRTKLGEIPSLYHHRSQRGRHHR